MRAIRLLAMAGLWLGFGLAPAPCQAWAEGQVTALRVHLDAKRQTAHLELGVDLERGRFKALHLARLPGADAGATERVQGLWALGPGGTKLALVARPAAEGGVDLLLPGPSPRRGTYRLHLNYPLSRDLVRGARPLVISPWKRALHSVEVSALVPRGSQAEPIDGDDKGLVEFRRIDSQDHTLLRWNRLRLPRGQPWVIRFRPPLSAGPTAPALQATKTTAASATILHELPFLALVLAVFVAVTLKRHAWAERHGEPEPTAIFAAAFVHAIAAFLLFHFSPLIGSATGALIGLWSRCKAPATQPPPAPGVWRLASSADLRALTLPSLRLGQLFELGSGVGNATLILGAAGLSLVAVQAERGSGLLPYILVGASSAVLWCTGTRFHRFSDLPEEVRLLQRWQDEFIRPLPHASAELMVHRSLLPLPSAASLELTISELPFRLRVAHRKVGGLLLPLPALVFDPLRIPSAVLQILAESAPPSRTHVLGQRRLLVTEGHEACSELLRQLTTVCSREPLRAAQPAAAGA